MLLAKLAYSRRQFSPLRAAHPRCPYALTAVVRVVHRTQANAFPNAFALGSPLPNEATGGIVNTWNEH